MIKLEGRVLLFDEINRSMYDDVKRVYRFDKYMGGVTPV